MTRKILMTTSTIAALVAAPLAHADGSIESELPGNSPAITDYGTKTDVGSLTNSDKEQLGTRFGVGIAEYDPTRMTMPEEEYMALMTAVGGDFATSDGMLLGKVTAIDFDAQGNPELSIALLEDTRFDAENLILTLLPESVKLSGNQIIIDETADDLYLAASTSTAREVRTVNVNIM
ncbi:hypothetical protein [Sulfitobacter sp. JB4-11]|uniref:hypothetical protein n=1 Tax=Sulfitobacter rhodophyticola TaxID=3238304 RepID=UPI0035158999